MVSPFVFYLTKMYSYFHTSVLLPVYHVLLLLGLTHTYPTQLHQVDDYFSGEERDSQQPVETNDNTLTRCKVTSQYMRKPNNSGTCDNPINIGHVAWSKCLRRDNPINVVCAVRFNTVAGTAICHLSWPSFRSATAAVRPVHCH